MPFSAVLLAGGKSSRMGRDKAFLQVDGEPLWRRQMKTLRALRPEQLLISGPPRPEWRDEETIADELADAGPLAGIAAALSHCATSHLLVLAVDLPRMKADFLERLLELCAHDEGVIPRAAGRFEPLAAIYPACSLARAKAALAAGELSLQHFARGGIEAGWLRERGLSVAEKALFKNLNTPADL